MNVVEEWSHIFLAKGIISTSCDDDCRVYWQVAHSVAEPGTRRLTACLNCNEFTLDDFTVNSDWLEVSQFVDQFSIALLTAEVVNTILDCVTLKLWLSFLRFSLTFLVLKVSLALIFLGGITAQAPPWITGSIELDGLS